MIQAATVHVGMLIAGRIVGGFAVGIMSKSLSFRIIVLLTCKDMTIPIYNSEIAPSHKRGLIAGLHAQFVGFGFAMANVSHC